MKTCPGTVVRRTTSELQAKDLTALLVRLEWGEFRVNTC